MPQMGDVFDVRVAQIKIRDLRSLEDYKLRAADETENVGGALQFRQITLMEIQSYRINREGSVLVLKVSSAVCRADYFKRLCSTKRVSTRFSRRHDRTIVQRLGRQIHPAF